MLAVPFEPEDVLLTTGGFSAISVAMKSVADLGDEIIDSLPPWLMYEGLAVEAGLVPVEVRIVPESFDLDVGAIAAIAAITPRTRIVSVNTPNNLTRKIFPPATLRRLASVLEEASGRNVRRISLFSDEPHNRIVFDGARFQSPVEVYPYTLLASSYGKTHPAPASGSALSPRHLPCRGERPCVRRSRT